MNHAIKILLAGIGGLAGLAVALMPTPSSAQVAPDQVPPALRAAIQQRIEAEGHEFAGLCQEANQQSPLPFGKWCAMVLKIENGVAEISYGAVASDELRTATFRESNGSWQAADAQAPGQIPTALRTAIQQLIEAEGHEFAGLCQEANQQSPLPIGKWCAMVLKIENGVAEISYGAVASDELRTATFRESNGNWRAVTTATPTSTNPQQPTSVATPRPPVTGLGTATAGDSNDGSWAIAAAVLLLMVAGATTSLSLVIRRR